LGGEGSVPLPHFSNGNSKGKGTRHAGTGVPRWGELDGRDGVLVQLPRRADVAFFPPLVVAVTVTVFVFHFFVFFVFVFVFVFFF
jgi:hypothetical protein